MIALTECPHCDAPADSRAGICPGCRLPIDDRSADLERELKETLGDRYELVGRVGSGAYGEVFRAHDMRLDRDVAIKQIRLDGFRSSDEAEEMKLRSLREAKMAAKLVHPNIVTVHDVIDLLDSTLIIMEFVDGTSLESRLREYQRLGFDETLALMSQTAAALDHAHEAGVVHRDIKPANLMIDGRGNVRITDFGIAKTETGADITATGNVLGTPYYMAPEQARGADRLDGRADLFSLGCVAYECLSGQKPFRGKAVVDILLRILHEPPAELDCKALQIPLGVPDVLHRALAKKASERFTTARELIEALSASALTSPAEGTVNLSERPPSSPVAPPVITRRPPGTTSSFDIRYQGSLTERGLAEVLGDIHGGGRTGILHVQSDEHSKRVYFRDGDIVFANSDAESERLGRFLVRGGLIDESTYESARRAMETSGLRLGRALVESGTLEAERVEALVAEQVREIVVSMFGWSSGHYGFESLEPPVEEDIALELSTGEIILHGVRLMASDESIRTTVGSLDRVPSLSKSTALVDGEVTLTASEGYVLSRIDGATSVADLMAICSMQEEETLRCIYALVSMGAVQLDKPGTARPAASFGTLAEELGTDRVRHQSAPADEAELVLADIAKKRASLGRVTHYELLEVAPDASHSQIKAGFFALAKRYHPDRHRAEVFCDVQADLEAILIGIREAFDVLRRPVHRVGYDSEMPALHGDAPAPAVEDARAASSRSFETPKSPEPNPSGAVPHAFASPRAMAQERYRAGKEHYERQDYHEAVESLREAVRLDDDKPEYHRVLALSLAKNPRWKAEAVKHFHRAIKLAPFNTAGYVDLARFYDEGGLSTRARKVYEQVLELNPDHEVANSKVGATGGAVGERWLEKTGVLKWLRRGSERDSPQPESEQQDS